VLLRCRRALRTEGGKTRTYEKIMPRDRRIDVKACLKEGGNEGIVFAVFMAESQPEASWEGTREPRGQEREDETSGDRGRGGGERLRNSMKKKFEPKGFIGFSSVVSRKQNLLWSIAKDLAFARDQETSSDHSGLLIGKR